MYFKVSKEFDVDVLGFQTEICCRYFGPFKLGDCFGYFLKNRVIFSNLLFTLDYSNLNLDETAASFCCQSGSKGTRYVFQISFSEKLQKAFKSTNTEVKEKTSTDFEFLEFYTFSDVCLTTLKSIKFYLTKLATDF